MGDVIVCNTAAGVKQYTGFTDVVQDSFASGEGGYVYPADDGSGNLVLWANDADRMIKYNGFSNSITDSFAFAVGGSSGAMANMFRSRDQTTHLS